MYFKKSILPTGQVSLFSYFVTQVEVYNPQQRTFSQTFDSCDCWFMFYVNRIFKEKSINELKHNLDHTPTPSSAGAK
jgi:hypothetical protein